MPKLKNHKPDDSENLKLLKELQEVVMVGSFTYQITISDDALLSNKKKQWATVATLKTSKSESKKEPIFIDLTQFANRFNSKGTYPQLVLLSTEDQKLMGKVFDDEATYTGVGEAEHIEKYGEPFRYLLKNRLQLANSSEYVPRNINTALIKLKQKVNNDDVYNQLVKGLSKKTIKLEYRENFRFQHHESKSSKKMSKVFDHMKSLVDGDDDVKDTVLTALRGEYAAIKVMTTVLGQNVKWQLKKGLSLKGGQNGIDQIWVERDSDGDITRYLLVEAKGSVKAKLGYTQQGEQMSPRWVVYVLLQMANSNGSYIDGTNPNQSRTATKILDAIFDDSGKVKVSGIQVQSLYGSDNSPNIVRITDLGCYNNPNALKKAQSNKSQKLINEIGIDF